MKKDDDLEYFMEQLAKGCELSAQLDYTPGEPHLGWKITVQGYRMICEMGLASVINTIARRAADTDTRSINSIKVRILTQIGKFCGLKLVCVGQCESMDDAFLNKAEDLTPGDETENLYKEI